MPSQNSLLERLYDRAPALQYRDFRLIWIGQLISIMGTQMQSIAVDWHIYRLLQGSTYSLTLFGQEFSLNAAALGLGSLGLVRVIPIVIFALIGGIAADTRDRRQVLIWTQNAAAFFALLLAAITLSGYESLAAIYLLSAALSATNAFDNPARQALVPNLVPREHFTNAVSLNTLVWQLASITGPAIAGILVASFNVGVVYVINAISFTAVIAALWMMNYRGKPASRDKGLGWDALTEGLRFVYGAKLIWSTMLLDFFATFFSAARTMLPIVASEVLGVGAAGYGLLATAQPLGAVIAGTVAALSKQIHRQGVILLASVAIYGLATALFGVSTVFVLSYFFFAMTGAADTVSMVIRVTLRNMITPDHLRGRMTSVNMMFFMGGPQLGEVEAGLVAALFGAPFAIVTGGIATILLTGWVAWKYPDLRNYTSDTALNPPS